MKFVEELNVGSEKDLPLIIERIIVIVESGTRFIEFFKVESLSSICLGRSHSIFNHCSVNRLPFG